MKIFLYEMKLFNWNNLTIGQDSDVLYNCKAILSKIRMRDIATNINLIIKEMKIYLYCNGQVSNYMIYVKSLKDYC